MTSMPASSSPVWLPGLPGDARVSFVVRDNQLVSITGDTTLRLGDNVLVLGVSESVGL